MPKSPSGQTQEVSAIERTSRRAEARLERASASLTPRAPGGAARTPAKLSASRANGSRGGRPVTLGTIATDAGRATVRYAPGARRVECVLPDGTIEVPEDASAANREEAIRTAEALWGRDLRTWDWRPA